MLQAYGLSQNQNAVKDWYNGYTFGSAQVYNPWSVINYVDSCRINKNATLDRVFIGQIPVQIILSEL